MVWTPPTPKKAGDPFDHVLFNTEVLDNLSHLFTLLGAEGGTLGTFGQNQVLTGSSGGGIGAVTITEGGLVTSDGTQIINFPLPGSGSGWHLTV